MTLDCFFKSPKSTCILKIEKWKYKVSKWFLLLGNTFRTERDLRNYFIQIIPSNGAQIRNQPGWVWFKFTNIWETTICQMLCSIIVPFINLVIENPLHYKRAYSHTLAALIVKNLHPMLWVNICLFTNLNLDPSSNKLNFSGRHPHSWRQLSCHLWILNNLKPWSSQYGMDILNCTFSFFSLKY